MSGSSDAARTLRAAAEIFVPGPPHDDTPGAADIEADRFIEHYLDVVMPGLSSVVPAILDDAIGGSFADAPIPARARALAALEEHADEQVRQLPRLLAVLTLAAVYGEWSGLDQNGALVRTPLGWEQTGFEGPTRGRPGLLHEP